MICRKVVMSANVRREKQCDRVHSLTVCFLSISIFCLAVFLFFFLVEEEPLLIKSMFSVNMSNVRIFGQSSVSRAADIPQQTDNSNTFTDRHQRLHHHFATKQGYRRILLYLPVKEELPMPYLSWEDYFSQICPHLSSNHIYYIIG